MGSIVIVWSMTISAGPEFFRIRGSANESRATNTGRLVVVGDSNEDFEQILAVIERRY